MIQGERGFSILELIVGLGISVIIGAATIGGTGHLWNGSSDGGDYLNAVSQVQNAGRWIGRDSRTAEAVATDNLSASEFVVMSWTDYEYGVTDDVYHSATYYFSGMTGNVGDLKRRYWNSVSGNIETLVARGIYYNAADPSGSSLATQLDGVLYVRLARVCGNSTEIRVFHMDGRPEGLQW
jgi:hypothetical protein